MSTLVGDTVSTKGGVTRASCCADADVADADVADADAVGVVVGDVATSVSSIGVSASRVGAVTRARSELTTLTERDMDSVLGGGGGGGGGG